MNLREPWSLRELVADLTAGRTTPAEALERSRAKVADTDPALRAWVEPLDETAPAAGPLGGVPLGVKDIVDVAGVPTRCGTELRADAPPAPSDAAIVRAWRTAGAFPVGKTVTTEFAYFSPGPTRNPADPERTPGGSSSGSAAAVAAGHVPLAIGSQTAGSVTRPAAFCGVASLVLSHGRIPTDGVVGLAPSLDSHGFFTATTADLALAWSALTGTPEAAPKPAPRLLRWTGAALGAGDAVSAAVDDACARLSDRGAVVTAFPHEVLVAELAEAHPVVMAYEAARERADELAVADRISEHLATLLRTGAATSDDDYAAARKVVTEANRRLDRLECDAIVGPAAPGPAPRGLAATGDPVMSRPWQALGLPAATVPGQFDEAGAPLGVQLIGHRHGERALLATARRAEREDSTTALDRARAAGT
ncbi:amidase [Saccharopolyspora rhizosphaerae]|uniref:Amidase n=1 Tax=Saccharopolyspora rhizosphaerae TaxID=2492662 RepID=A0A426JXP9_9PSEU|nr:amidase [Saccharopolyspora rhizosphaerae]RRO17946.1 amidase [Saccharopolyspora rhizosphaerae]